MDFKKLADKAKHAIDERGGTERLKQEAERLREIATGPGSAKEKAKAAGDALRHPHRPEAEDVPSGTTATDTTTAGSGTAGTGTTGATTPGPTSPAGTPPASPPPLDPTPPDTPADTPPASERNTPPGA